MDWLREVEKRIFGDEWRTMPTTQKDIVEKVLVWCANNREEIPIEPISRTFWGAKLIEVIDESLKELYGRGIDYYMEKRREQERVDMRNKIFYIIWRKSRYTLTSIGELFDFHHSTIIHALKSHETLCKYSKEYESSYEQLLKTIEEKCEKQLTSRG